MKQLIYALTLSLLAMPLLAAEPLPPDHAARMATGTKLFKSSVRQVLLEHCVDCHGGKKIKADLNIATRELLLKGGVEGPSISFTEPYKSRFIKLLRHEESPHMPHKAPKLSDQAIKDIAEWIRLGAPYDEPLAEVTEKKSDKLIVTDDDREFWSFKPLSNVNPPSVKHANHVRNAIDQFIIAKLDQKKLTPSPAADRRTLIRRLYFDVIGLPPTPDEINGFINDTSADAYDRLVDRLLASEHFGERWARHWLDVARYAESTGFEHDYDRKNAYHYRDFVIRALNQNMPFDQFVRWQIAGDEIAPDDPLALMATGFLTAGVYPTQITNTDAERVRYDDMDDMLATVGTSMLGLTIGCARCHDHKYDPIPMADYYQMLSTFTTTVRAEVQADLTGKDFQERRSEHDAAHRPLVAALESYERDNLSKRLDDWLAERNKGQAAIKQDWLVLDVQSHKGQATFKKLDDGSLLATGTNPRNDHYTFTASVRSLPIHKLRLEALTDPSMKGKGPGRAGNGNFQLTGVTLKHRPAGSNADYTTVKLAHPKATHEQNTGHLSIASSIDGNKGTGWAVDGRLGRSHAAVYSLTSPIDTTKETELVIDLDFSGNVQHNIGRPRLSVSSLAEPPVVVGDQGNSLLTQALHVIDTKGRDALTAQQRRTLLAQVVADDPEWTRLRKLVDDHAAKAPQPKLTTLLVGTEGKKPYRHHVANGNVKYFYDDTYHLNRGDPNQKGDVATQGFMQVLMRKGVSNDKWLRPKPASATTSHRRTAFADWITDDQDGPGHLLARVIVNRVWLHLMGRGIVSTPNDFGFQGNRPSHPELLDWLAKTLIENDWDLKSIHRLIVTSATYRQSSATSSDNSRSDPDNQWFWRRNTRRLEAEIIRDSILAVSGRLDATMFGPGTLSEGMTRRSIYFQVKRSRLIPMLLLFDWPEALTSLGQRPATTVAPQALMFMNNPTINGYCSSFATKLAPIAQSDLQQAVTVAYESALGRPPTDAESGAATHFITQQTKRYGNVRQALIDFARVILSLNEFVFIR